MALFRKETNRWYVNTLYLEGREEDSRKEAYHAANNSLAESAPQRIFFVGNILRDFFFSLCHLHTEQLVNERFGGTPLGTLVREGICNSHVDHDLNSVLVEIFRQN
jgi:hypothetical protein